MINLRRRRPTKYLIPKFLLGTNLLPLPLYLGLVLPRRRSFLLNHLHILPRIGESRITPKPILNQLIFFGQAKCLLEGSVLG